jgi:hypothetical protein
MPRPREEPFVRSHLASPNLLPSYYSRLMKSLISILDERMDVLDLLFVAAHANVVEACRTLVEKQSIGVGILRLRSLPP